MNNKISETKYYAIDAGWCGGVICSAKSKDEAIEKLKPYIEEFSKYKNENFVDQIWELDSLDRPIIFTGDLA